MTGSSATLNVSLAIGVEASVGVSVLGSGLKEISFLIKDPVTN